MSNSWSLLGLICIGSIAILAACDDKTGEGAIGAECKSFYECSPSLICYSGTCRSAVDPALTCQVDVDKDTDNDGVIDLRGCNPVDTPETNLRVVCRAQRCRLVPEDRPVVAVDAGPTDTGTSASPMDAGQMDASTMMMTDAAFVARASACAFPVLASNNEDTSAPSFYGIPAFTVNGMSGSAAVNSGDSFEIALTVGETCGLAWAKAVLQTDAAMGTTNAAERIVLEGDTYIRLQNGVGASMDESLVTILGGVSPCLQNTGQYSMTELHLRDFAGNTSVYTLSSATGTYNVSQNGGASSNAGVPEVRISVGGTGTTESPPAPLNTVVASSNASGMNVEVSISNQNVTCYLNQVEVTATSSTGQVVTGVATAQPATPPTNGQLTVAVSIPTCAQNGGWTVTSVRLTDTAGRSTEYTTSGGANYVRSDGQATAVNPATVTLTGGTDSASPDLVDVQVQTSGETGGTAVSLNVVASDDACNVGSNTVRFTHSSGASFAAELDVTHPIGTGCIPIPLCAPRGDYTLSTITVSDEGGASVTASESGGTYTVSKTGSSTTGWVPPAAIIVTQ